MPDTADPDFVGIFDRPNPSGIFMFYLIIHFICHLKQTGPLFLFISIFIIKQKKL